MYDMNDIMNPLLRGGSIFCLLCCYFFYILIWMSWIEDYLRAHGLDIFVGFCHLQLVVSRMDILLYIGISFWIACLLSFVYAYRVNWFGFFLAFCALRRSQNYLLFYIAILDSSRSAHKFVFKTFFFSSSFCYCSNLVRILYGRICRPWLAYYWLSLKF